MTRQIYTGNMIDKKHIGYEFLPVTVPVEEGRLKFLAKALGETGDIYTNPDAAKAAGLEPTETDDQVRFPRRPFVRSGYIILEKKLPKTKILDKISEKMVVKRAKQSK